MWWSFNEACPDQSENRWLGTSAEDLPTNTYYCHIFPHVNSDKIIFFGQGAERRETIRIAAIPW